MKIGPQSANAPNYVWTNLNLVGCQMEMIKFLFLSLCEFPFKSFVSGDKL